MSLTLAEPRELASALSAALRGGPVVAPLPADPVERATALAMLRPELPVVESDAAAVVITSGSTAGPKGVVLSRSAIVASVEATHGRLGGPGDWLLALPGHYVAGLMVVARGIVAGTSVHEVGRDLSGVPEALQRATRPAYLSLVATQLTRALNDAALRATLARLEAVLLGGGPAPAKLLERAQRAGIRVVTTYGMSETSGGCVYDGQPLDGVEVELDERGTVIISGPVICSGYRLRPDLTAQTLRDNRFRTSDRGRWRDGRLEILGRLDDVVISGGLNIDLGEVERAARPWADRRSATLAVLGLPDPDWGTAVIAVVDVMPGSDGNGQRNGQRNGRRNGRGDDLEDDIERELEDLRAYLAHSLPVHALPKRLVHRSPLPRTPGGKIDRHRLRTELTAGGTEPERRR